MYCCYMYSAYANTRPLARGDLILAVDQLISNLLAQNMWLEIQENKIPVNNFLQSFSSVTAIFFVTPKLIRVKYQKNYLQLECMSL